MMTDVSKYIDCPLMHGLQANADKEVILVNALFLFSSDQEPPYSMITLHEMAETGKEKTAGCSWTLKHRSSVLSFAVCLSPLFRTSM